MLSIVNAGNVNGAVHALRTCSRRLVAGIAMLLGVALSIGGASVSAADGNEIPRAKAEAPPGQTSVADGLGGSFYVPTVLKDRYDRMVKRVHALEAEIVAGQIEERDAKIEIALLRKDLESARKQIEAQKTFVPAAKVHTQSSTTEFELGPEKCLFIIAQRVKIVGWNEPRVKCVLDKSVLTAGDEPFDDQFEAIQLTHRHGPADDTVGYSLEESAAKEAEFLNSPAGQKLDDKQREFRRKLDQQIVEYHALYRQFQGKPIDVITVGGLTGQEGNRQITLELSSAGDGATNRSVWRRYATLTVFVPASKAVGLQGGLQGLDVKSLEADLVVRGDGDRDYYGAFRIADHHGSLAIEGIPLQSLDNIRGNVSVVATAYLGNSGVQHADGTKTCFVEPPEPYVYSNIQGDLRGRFVRANLALSGITGQIDVDNEYGDTALTGKTPLAERAHRIVSIAGQIKLQLDRETLGKLPLVALTETGTVRVDSEGVPLEEVHFTGAAETDSVRRGWTGFESKQDQDRPPFERVWQAWLGQDRAAGLDVINRGGSVRIAAH